MGRHSLKGFFGGLVLGIISASLGLLSAYWSGILQIRWNPVEWSVGVVGLVFWLALGWFGVALWEEVFFRGYMIQTLASGFGLWPAALISSVVFGLFHTATYGMKAEMLLSATLLGIVLCVLYLRSKSLWASIGMHFAHNFWLAHVVSNPIWREIRFPFITVNGQPVYLEPLCLLWQADFVEGKGPADLYSWADAWSTLSTLIALGLFILLIWKLPLFRPHPEMEALWQQYVPIARPWAQLKAWWARRKGHAATTEDPPPQS